MRQIILFFIRKIKAFFMWFRLDVIFLPFSAFFLNLVYISKLSKWRSQNKNLKFNDFLNLKWSYQSRFDLYKHLIDNENCSSPVNFFEFGVATGTSFKWWLEQNKNPQSKFYGFDTFEGLPEDWGTYKAGEMNANLPQIDDNRHEFLKGLFQDTLFNFIETHRIDNNRIIIHLDADLFSSTLFVLTTLAKYLKPGDLIFFDEFNVPNHEFFAFKVFTESFYVKYELIGAVNNYYQVAFKVK